jgi:hypothetical protein
MFYFPGYASIVRQITNKLVGFPHSEINGSKVAWHLTVAYRSFATSFIAFLIQGIHHMLLHFQLGNALTTLTLSVNYLAFIDIGFYPMSFF